MVHPNIRTLREDRDWSQEYVASQISVNRRTYSGYELRSEVQFGSFQRFPELVHPESNTFHPSFLRCSHSLFPILGQVMGQERSGDSKTAMQKTKKNTEGKREA